MRSMDPNLTGVDHRLSTTVSTLFPLPCWQKVGFLLAVKVIGRIGLMAYQEPDATVSK